MRIVGDSNTNTIGTLYYKCNKPKIIIIMFMVRSSIVVGTVKYEEKKISPKRSKIACVRVLRVDCALSPPPPKSTCVCLCMEWYGDDSVVGVREV